MLPNIRNIDLMPSSISQVGVERSPLRSAQPFVGDSLLAAIDQSMLVVQMDLSGRIISANTNFAALLGEPSASLVGRTFAQIMVDPLAICPSHPQTLDQLRAGRAWWGVIHCQVIAGDGDYWLDLTCSPLRDAQGQVMGMVALGVDVTESVTRRPGRHSDQGSAVYDALTGLPNRSLLATQLDQAIADMSMRESALSVVLIDIDRFREVNETLGQAVGDAVLREMAQRLTDSLRGGDIVGRLSGDQFMVVLPQCDAAGVEVVSGHLRDQLIRPFICSRGEILPSVSMGISLYPANGHDIDTLLKHAEFALRQAKDSGRSRIHFFSPTLNRLANDRRDLEIALKAALESDGLSLHYQPQVDMETEALCGVEALARWTHPTRGNLSPDVFVPIAEDSGLIQVMGEWALREACRQLAHWRAQGLAVPSISVNLSPTNFQHPELPGLIQETLAQHGLAPADLTLEMTESVMMEKQTETIRILSTLDTMGVRLSMDDFGTGYSSLGHLRRLPVTELKLDRSFVVGLETVSYTHLTLPTILRV